ncbi:hypothetical protein LIER_12796 [Lithospermum erythrorhizon]|uniref:Sec-independent protein translocase protein TATA, chloroplastic n=1 Tax=Lithospermum erythrorhizon TaxID=34254 RepID=A0AAV3PTV2_LITER
MAISLSTSSLTLSSTNLRGPISSSSLTSSLASSNSLFFNRTSQRAGFGPTIKARTRDNGKKRGMSCKSIFGLGVPELVVIGGVIALVFGPSKLPEVGRSFGKTIKSFQQAAKEFETELKKEPEPGAETSQENAIAESNEEIPKSAALSEEKQDLSV